jgi:hypothetical protein
MERMGLAALLSINKETLLRKVIISFLSWWNGVDNEKNSFNFIDEALRIVNMAKQHGLTLRLMGAVAVRLHCPKYALLHEKIGREFSDLDLVGYVPQGSKISSFMQEIGYERRAIRPSYGVEMRHKYVNNGTGCVVDIFLDKLIMCHTIDFRNRLEADYPTIPLAELLLTKLQIVDFTEKDFKDVVVLFMEHEVGESDEERFNKKIISNIMSDDWGFYYTVTTNLEKIIKLLPTQNSLKEKKEDVESKIKKLLETIETSPKSFKWKMRAKIGTKKKWYNEVF